MAKEAVARLFRASQKDQDLRDKLNQSEDLDTFIRMAKENGYEFTSSEWQSMTQFSVEEFKGELSEIPGI